MASAYESTCPRTSPAEIICFAFYFSPYPKFPTADKVHRKKKEGLKDYTFSVIESRERQKYTHESKHVLYERKIHKQA